MERLSYIIYDLFVAFNTESISYLIIRDYDSVTAISQASDIDLSISESDKNKAQTILKKNGWFTPRKNFNHYSHQQFYRWSDNRLYKIDVLWGVYFDDGKYRLNKELDIYSSYDLLDILKIPKPGIGLLLLYLHVLLDKKTLSYKNKNSLYHLLNRCEGEEFLYLKEIKKLVDDETLDYREYEAGVENALNNGTITRSFLPLRFVRRASIKFLAHLQKRQYTVALIGVDGSGKSSALQNLTEYYQGSAFTQYFGFRDYKTNLAKKLCDGNKRFKNKYISNLFRCVALYNEMLYRYNVAKKSGKRILLFDRYVWEAADNSVLSAERVLNTLLFKKLFPNVDTVIYLYCPVDISLSRKNDIEDVDCFVRMKERFDKLYMRKEGSLAIDTSITPREEVLGLIVLHICKLTDAVIV